MSLEEYFGDWLKVIDKQELYEVVNKINILYKTQKCEPAYKDIFKVFNITPYNDLCMVWLAQDPYPQLNVPNGIAFGNKISKEQLSPSLQVIKEAVINFEVPHNLITFDPTLEEWSKQGILLLNSSLTVELNKPNSHANIWRSFIKSLLINLSILNPGLIYVLWGSEAKTFRHYIGCTNIVHTMPHPAYYARTNTKIPYKFFTDLKTEVYNKFDKQIEWYKEQKF
jgi:uracil-DNA glycosylase